ncbi:hypothetical protein [Lysinibacillus sphaericus]|nr:hypothetical protein [Lysinibacillus sphaericus]
MIEKVEDVATMQQNVNNNGLQTGGYWGSLREWLSSSELAA